MSNDAVSSHLTSKATEELGCYFPTESDCCEPMPEPISKILSFDQESEINMD